MGRDIVYEDKQEFNSFGNPLIHASSDWPISVEVGSKSNTVSTFAQRQRPRSPVPAAIHERQESFAGDKYAEVTYVPVATAGPCHTNCQMVMPFMVLLFFMTLLVAVTQVRIIESICLKTDN
jgi:hypothetical protein